MEELKVRFKGWVEEAVLELVYAQCGNDVDKTVRSIEQMTREVIKFDFGSILFDRCMILCDGFIRVHVKTKEAPKVINQLVIQYLRVPYTESEKFQLFVKLQAVMLVLVIEQPRDEVTIQDIKEMIHDKKGVPVEQQRLEIMGRVLHDARTLQDYDINNEQMLNCVYRLRENHGCFVADTPVLLKGGQSIAIEQVQIGDMVQTHNMVNKQLEYHKVQEVLKYLVNETCVVSLNNHSQIECTASHPLYVANRDQWACVEPTRFNPSVGRLQIGDHLLHHKGGTLEVTGIEYEHFEQTNVPVYTLHIEEVHNFFANGVLVHNAMEIVVIHMLTGKPIRLTVEPSDTVSSVKQKIWSMENIVPDDQILLFAGKHLEDEKSLEDYSINIKTACNIELIAKNHTLLPINDDQ